MNPESGEVVSEKFEMLWLIGEGGMGTIYKVNHIFLDKPLALEVLKSNTTTRDAVLCFQSEAKALSALNHENIARG